MKLYASLILLLASLSAINNSWAEEAGIIDLKAQQRQLQLLLNEIEQSAQQREQHSQQLKRLKHQLECNWTLIRAYEICGQLHENDPEGHLNCSSTAKRNAARCLKPDQEK
jgi:hypothetical protein